MAHAPRPGWLGDRLLTGERTPVQLFVYGTLRYDSIVTLLTGETIAAVEAELPDHFRCRIEQPGRTGKGPMIRPQPGCVVRGTILQDISPRALAILDLYEMAGTGYERVEATAFLADGQPVPVHFYRTLPEFYPWLRDEWTPEAFEAAGYLEHYLQERIPNLLKLWREQGKYPELPG